MNSRSSATGQIVARNFPSILVSILTAFTDVVADLLDIRVNNHSTDVIEELMYTIGILLKLTSCIGVACSLARVQCNM